MEWIRFERRRLPWHVVLTIKQIFIIVKKLWSKGKTSYGVEQDVGMVWRKEAQV